MKVLVACEYSGRVREAMRNIGNDAWSCDLLESEDRSPYHIQDYVEELLKEPWDLIVAHPPCTYLCNSGVRWLYEKEGRWEQMRQGAAFFVEIMKANSPKIAIENPIMHKYSKQELISSGCAEYGFKSDGNFNFSVQPWQFGDHEKKRTCFWTKGLEVLTPTSSLTAKDAKNSCHFASPGPNRWKERSRTYQGIAKAIADQWGSESYIQHT